MTTERFSLADHLFNESKVAYLAGLLASAVPEDHLECRPPAPTFEVVMG